MSVAAVMSAEWATTSCATPEGDSARTVWASDNGEATRMEALEGSDGEKTTAPCAARRADRISRALA
jgi:hypothetical protein